MIGYQVVSEMAQSYPYTSQCAFVTQALRAPSPSLSDLPLYPFEPSVHTPLSTLTHAASLLTTRGPLTPQPQQGDVDYGTTYMLEEHWLPCVERRAEGLPPIDTIFVCSEAVDAAAIASTKVREVDILTKQSESLWAVCVTGHHTSTQPNRYTYKHSLSVR
jgi:hypothetical protein